MDENFQNCQFFLAKFWFLTLKQILEICQFSNLDNSKNLQFGKFQEFPTWKIKKMSDLENYEDCQFGKFQQFRFEIFPKLSIWKIREIFNLANFKKFQNFGMWKILKFVNFENS